MTPSGGGKKDEGSKGFEASPSGTDSAAHPSEEGSAHPELSRGATFLLMVKANAGDQLVDAPAVEQLVKKLQAANIWTSAQFVERIDRVPGLKELSGTPFMVQPSTRNPKPETLTSKPSTLNPEP